YAGADDGAIVKEMDRPDAERAADEAHRFYMPAGNQGPITKMGGAAETAPEPVRTPAREDPVPAPEEARPKQQLVAEDVGTPVEMPETRSEEDGVAEAKDAADGDEAAPEPPAEEEEGWGLQDWYD